MNMSAEQGDFKLPNHVGMVVKNIDETAELFSAVLGDHISSWEKFVVNPPKGQPEIPGEINWKVGFAKIKGLGDVQIELLQQLEGDSPYASFIKDARGERWHHIAFAAPDCAQLIKRAEARGGKMIFKFLFQGKYVYYLEMPGGFVFEFCET
jgi:4-hydroxyphenylpyruvate dioxygenase-like putative hemolysin